MEMTQTVRLGALIPFLLTCIGSAVCAAGADPGAPPASTIPALAEVELETEIGLPILELTVGTTSEPLTFVIDTGFDISILDAGTAARLGITPLEVRDEAQPGGTVQMAALPPTSIHIGALEVANVSLTTIDLSGLSMILGRPFHGILGHDVLERFVVDLDLPEGRLRLFEPESWRPPETAEFVEVTIRNGEPLVMGAVISSDGREIPALLKLDTGSFDIAGLNLNFVRENQVVPPGAPEVRQGGVAAGGETEGRLFRAGRLVLGPHSVERPLLGYTVDSAGFENREDAGTLGMGFLAKSRLVLDYPHHRVAFVGSATAPEEDRTGIRIASPGPDFVDLLVIMVADGSPGAAAGLEAGDQLVSIGGRRDLSLLEVRELQKAEGPLEVVYLRGGEEHRAVIHRRSLIP